MKEYIPLDWESDNSIIKVIGVGGGGCNAVSEMFRQGIKNVDFMICNTDTQSLAISPVNEKLQLGNVVTRGLGAGCNPEQGRKAAEESIEQIREKLEGMTEMIFLTAGMGGGTGTGATPVIAKVAKEMGILTVAVVTLPFRDEGVEFMKRAVLGIRELEKYVDCLLIIDNQKLYSIFGDLTIFDAFPKADTVLSTAVKGIAEIITRPGFINVDFADVRMVMSNSGMALMGSGSAEGENRAVRAVEEAFSSPLLNDFDLTTAKNVLVNITSGREKGLTMAELSQIMDYVKEYTGNHPEHFKRGVVCNESMGESISVTVVATGFDMNSLPQISSDGDKLVESVVLGSDSVLPEQFSLQDTKSSSDFYQQATGVQREPITPSKTRIKNSESPQENDKSEKRVKPALIIEEGDNIKELENQPAYIRKQMKMNSQASMSNLKEDMKIGSTFKLEEIDGKHQINPDNSFIHQTQD